MFFFVSKIFYFLLVPANWVLLLTVAWLLIRNKKWKKITGRAALIFALIFSNGLIYGLLMQWWQPAVKPQTHQKTYRVAVVMAGMSMGNAEKVRFFGGSVNDRFIQAARLYHTRTVEKILISGGSGSLFADEPSEASFLKQEFMAMGIPEQAILMETQSRNSYESAVNARPILTRLNAGESFVVVTSALHMKRALACFERTGLKPEPHVAHFEVLNFKPGIGSFIPDITLLYSWQYLLKEMIGFAVYRVTGKV